MKPMVPILPSMTPNRKLPASAPKLRSIYSANRLRRSCPNNCVVGDELLNVVQLFYKQPYYRNSLQ